MSKVPANPYLCKGNLGLLNSFCLFIDFLGYSRRICKISSVHDKQKEFKRFRKLVLSTITDLRFKDDVSKSFNRKRSRPNIWQMKTFSDNILLGAPRKNMPSDGESLWAFIALDIQRFQFQLSQYGVFVRGGWTEGLLYIDDQIVYGEALIAAYKIEQTIFFPCIVISEDIKRIVQSHFTFYGGAKLSAHYGHILVYDNKFWFINYLYEAVQDGAFFEKELRLHKEHIVTNLKTYKAERGVRRKYEWLAEYHNYFCKNFIVDCPSDFIIAGKYRHTFCRIS